MEEPKRKVVLLPKLPGMVAVDWYKTVEQPNGELDTESLQKLKDSNVRVWIVSFCGKSQARKVKQKCGPLRDQGLIALNLHPEERLETSKMNMSNESILLDSPVLPSLGMMLMKLAKVKKGNDLFTLDYNFGTYGKRLLH